jgi:hypothetical protein
MVRIEAISAKNNVVIKLYDTTKTYRLERKFEYDGEWLVLTASGFVADGETVVPLEVRKSYLDADVLEGIYQYRARDYSDETKPYLFTAWVKCGIAEPIGYMFGNYKVPEGKWGEVLTPDDIRYGWVWGIDFRATNGDTYTDEQLKFFIDSALSEMSRRLNITIKKKRIACEPDSRNMVKGVDYDEEESYYPYRREQVQRSGYIETRKRPVLELTRLDLFSRNNRLLSLLENSTLDKTKGKIKFFNRPLRSGDSVRAVYNSIMPYGQDQFNSQLFYAIDYVAGFENSDAVPDDLRAAIGKMCAIEALNIVGDGLLAGFSSSSLSMDGVSESMSSTQSATSAFYGARIMEYGKELDKYISDNKQKFSNIRLGCL